jgi:hypothetical protein
MPTDLSTTTADLSGNCTVEEAEVVFDWLIKNPKCELNLDGVDHLHASILQTIMATNRQITKGPADIFSAECIRQAKLGSEMEHSL